MADDLIARCAEEFRSHGVAIHENSIVEHKNGVLGHVKQSAEFGLILPQSVLRPALFGDVVRGSDHF